MYTRDALRDVRDKQPEKPLLKTIMTNKGPYTGITWVDGVETEEGPRRREERRAKIEREKKDGYHVLKEGRRKKL